MAISNSDIRQMRSRIQDALNNPTRRKQRSRKRKVAKAMEEQMELGDFIVAMMGCSI